MQRTPSVCDPSVIDIGRELRERPLDNGDSLMLAFHASAVAAGPLGEPVQRAPWRGKAI
jgi:hypothetical protein